MRLQGALGHRPQPLGRVVVGHGDPIVERAIGLGLHGAGDFGLALQAVRLQAANHLAGVKWLAGQVAQDISMGGQDQTDVVAGAGRQQFVQRIEVAPHVTVGRADDGDAAVENDADGGRTLDAF